MSLGLLGRKKGMTQIFDENGAALPVTVVEAGPCTVVQTKTRETDGYPSIQLGFETAKPRRLNKPQKGHFEKKKTALFRQLKEFRFAGVENFATGQMLTVACFQTGDRVDVQGVVKGRGFQGVIKRHGKQGGPDAHGSDFHRRPGSIGMRTWPGRVLKNMRLPGRMGGNTIKTRNLRVVGVNPQENLLLIHGAIPGSREGLVVIYNRQKDFAQRFKKEEAKQ